MDLLGRRLDAAIAAGAAALAATGLVTAALTAAPNRAAAATIDPRPQAVAPHRVGTASAATTSTGSPSSADPTLTATIRQKLSRATAGGYAVTVDIEGRGRVVSVQPGAKIRPASTQKLFTTLPLLLANPDRQLITDIRAGGRVVNGVLNGNLVVKSSGDPSLMRWHLSRLARQVR